MFLVFAKRPDDGDGAELLLTPDALEDLLLVPERLREVLLRPEAAGPVIDRLFPKAHDTPEDQREHRRLLGTALFEERLENLGLFEETLKRVRPQGLFLHLRIASGEVHLWLHVVNDVRLILATGLGIEDDDWHEQPPEDEEARRDFDLLESLSELQVVLLDVLAR